MYVIRRLKQFSNVCSTYKSVFESATGPQGNCSSISLDTLYDLTHIGNPFSNCFPTLHGLSQEPYVGPRRVAQRRNFWLTTKKKRSSRICYGNKFVTSPRAPTHLVTPLCMISL